VRVLRSRARETELQSRYLALLKGALTHTLYWPLDLMSEEDGIPVPADLRQQVQEALAAGRFDMLAARHEGRDWPQFAQTMVGIKRLENVQRCIESVLQDQIRGDLIEAGVWRGGVAIFMRAMLMVYGDPTRQVFAADSFQGLPKPDAQHYPEDAGDDLHSFRALAVSLEEVKRNFSLYGLLDDRVTFLEGWFRDTLPTVRDRKWAVIRLDGDMYESTMDTLQSLYPSLSVGGYVIVDDYAREPCRAAVQAFRQEHGVDEPIEEADWTAVFWRRRR